MARLATTRWEPDQAPPEGSAPLAVLIHGVTSSADTWWRVGPALAERGWSVLAVDLRGHGRSPRGFEGIGLADLAADVAETVRAEAGQPPGAPPEGGRDGEPLVGLLVGHSLGALTAMTLLAAEPSFARLVVLEDPPCQEAVDWPAEADRVGRDAHLARTDPDALRAELRAPPDSLSERDAEHKINCLLALDVETLQAVLRSGMVFDVAALARKVTVPALLFLGEPQRGSLLFGEPRAATATGLAQGWTEVVPAGHSIHRDAHESFMRRLDAWLDRVGGAARTRPVT
jgi:pimeloyl-ACP methyl ester carboxylesterase